MTIASPIPSSSGDPYPSLPPMESYSILPPNYAYEYDVNDGPYGPVFGLKEKRKDENTNGEYNVNLPSGRAHEKGIIVLVLSTF